MITTSGIGFEPQTPLSAPLISRPPLSWRHRVRTKLMALVLLMFVPISAVSVLQSYLDYNRRVAEELQANVELADSIGLAFRNYAEGVSYTAEILATTLYWRGVPMSPGRAQEMLRAQAMAHPGVDAFAWFDADGALLASSDRASASTYPFEIFKRFEGGEDRVIAASIPEHDANQSILVLASAIRDGETLRGSIAAIIDPDNLSRVLPVERRKGRTISLADENDFLVHVNPSEEVPYGARQLEVENSLRTLIQDDAYTFLDFEAPWDGVVRMGAVVPIPEIGWSVIAAAPKKQVVGPLIAERVRNTLLLIAVAVLSFGAASLIARDLAKRLGQLWEAALSWSQANFKVRAEVVGGDELSQTTITFNDMAARLQRLEEEREEFLHTAAHEMANPVTSILTVVQLLRHQIRRGGAPLEPGNLERKLDAIERDANILAGLIPDTVRLYRQEQNWAIRPQPIDLVPLLVDVVDAVRSRSEHVVNLNLDSRQEARINADPERIRQVLRNLIENAIKYSPRGEEIDVRLQRRDGMFNISVRDRGIGIPAGDEEVIFQSFHRAPNVQDIPGSGLGLFVSKQIVTAHGGKIWARNNPDGGATFYVQLP